MLERPIRAQNYPPACVTSTRRRKFPHGWPRSMSIRKRSLWILAFALALTPSVTTAAQHCVVGPYQEFSTWLRKLGEERRNLDILECLESRDEELVKQANAEASNGDLYRYVVAWSASNAIERGGLVRHNALAAEWWMRYLDGLQPPIDPSRVNHGLMKLVQHGRLEDFERFAETGFGAVVHLANELKSEAFSILLNTLYRCDAWSVVSPVGAEVVCKEKCKPLFERFLKASTGANPSNLATSKIVRRDLDALRSRLRCDQ